MQTPPRQSLLSRIFRDKPTPMLERQPLCNGKAGGWQCVHYAPRGAMNTRFTGDLNGELVKIDDQAEFTKMRHCVLPGASVRLPGNPAELPSYCAHFEASRRPFDPLFEVPPPKELVMPAHLIGVPDGPNIQGMLLSARSGDDRPNAPTNWDEKPGAPVLPREPGDAPDAPARRGFTHCEVDDGKTACARKAPLHKVANLVPGDMEKTLAQVNCPGCLAAIASNVGIKTIVANRAKNLMDRLEEEANKAHDSTSDAAHSKHEAAAIKEASTTAPDAAGSEIVDAIMQHTETLKGDNNG